MDREEGREGGRQMEGGVGEMEGREGRREWEEGGERARGGE